MSRKIVLLAGSFNPPTRAHFKTVQAAMDHIGADAGYLAATSASYLTDKMKRAGDGFILSDQIRAAMLQEFPKEDPRMVFIGEEGMSSHGTTARIIKENPGAEVYTILGADKLQSLPYWKNAEQTLSRSNFLVFQRGDRSVESLIHGNELLRKYESRFTILPALDGLEDVSSTKVREAFFAGDKTAYRKLLLPGIADILDTLNPADYVAPSFEEIYRSLKSHGRFGRQKALQFVAQANADILPEIPGREEMLAATKVYDKEFSVDQITTESAPPQIACIKSSLVNAAEKLLQEGLHPAVISTASGEKPCEGYEAGKNLQTEQELCRCSNLSDSLYQFGNPRLKAVKEAKVPHKDVAYPLNPHFGGIYSPGVTFFRKGFHDCYTKLDNPFQCSVISIPALSKQQEPLTPELEQMMQDKIRTMLRIAIGNGHDSLVIGDFAVCSGVDSEKAVELFKQVLKEGEFSGKLRKILFAFDEGKGNKRYPVEEDGKYGAFYKEFND